MPAKVIRIERPALALLLNGMTGDNGRKKVTLPEADADKLVCEASEYLVQGPVIGAHSIGDVLMVMTSTPPRLVLTTAGANLFKRLPDRIM